MKNCIESLNPVFHIHRDMLLCHGFGKGKVLFNKQPQQFYFIFIEIVFGYAYVTFPDLPRIFFIKGLHSQKLGEMHLPGDIQALLQSAC